MLNNCTFQGRITRKLELRRTQSGKAVTSFSIAVEDDFKSSDGEKTTTFVESVAWGGLAELVDRYLDKGRMVVVSGRLANRDWTDKDGNKRRTTEIIASNVYFCDSKGNGAEGQQEAASYQTPSYPLSGTNYHAPIGAGGDFEEITGDDSTLPF